MGPKTMRRVRLNKETVRRLTSRQMSRNELARAAGGERRDHTFFCTNWVSCTWITCGTSDYGNTICPEPDF